MCGIVGIVSNNSAEYKSNITVMIDSIVHRGPDGNGIEIFENCILGHVRLSIVDLEGGCQPMKSPVSLTYITFNGEIYGYQQIKKEFFDYPFKTKSDTEVLLALYDKYKTGMMNKVPGMFSFAIWDENNQQLFCARDRFGEKPFYYAFGRDGEFIFASEIKAVIASGLIEPVLDLNSVASYLENGYIQPNISIYKNIYTLQPAHQLVLKNRNLNIERYWKLPDTNSKISEQEAMEEFERLFDKAVEKQLIADVPIGAFLSGGLDSSSVVASASKIRDGIKTISFGFGESLNELPFAKDVANKYSTDHIEIVAQDYNLAELLIKMQDIYDEPFGDSSNIPTYIISKEARKHLKVILSGDGGDELLAGYSFWYRDLLDFEIKATTYLKKYKMLYFRKKILNFIGLKTARMDKKLEWMNRVNLYDNLLDYYKKEKKGHKNRKFIGEIGLDLPTNKEIEFSYNSNTIDDALRMDLQDYMPGDILVKTDRAAMANSLELRAPFLDVEFAEFCISLPSNLKINDQRDKLIFRQVFEKYWPVSIHKRTKCGFGAPVLEWLQMDNFKELSEKYIYNKNLKMYQALNLNYERIIDEFSNLNQNSWNILVLSLWMESREFVL